MEIGIHAERCNCTTFCREGVEPMGDCIRRLPGDTVTARCNICGGTTWFNEGQCIKCYRESRERAKAQARLRHEQVLAAPANPVPIEDADYRPREPVPQKSPTPAFITGMEIVLKVAGNEIVIASSAEDVVRLLGYAARK